MVGTTEDQQIQPNPTQEGQIDIMEGIKGASRVEHTTKVNLLQAIWT